MRWPNELKEEAIKIHLRLLTGDVTATAEISELLLSHLISGLLILYPTVDDPHYYDTAAEDALLNYLRKPSTYDQTRGSLPDYLLMSARGDLLNNLNIRKHSISNTNENETENQNIVEISIEEAEYLIDWIDNPSVEDQVIGRLTPVLDQLKKLLPDTVDQGIIKLIMDGVRETKVYAEILGITHLSEEEQFSLVKRHKDRIKKAVQRHMKPAELKHDV